MAEPAFDLRERSDRVFFGLLGGLFFPPLYFVYAYVVLAIEERLIGSYTIVQIVTLPIFWPLYVFLHYFPPDPQDSIAVNFALLDPIGWVITVIGNFHLYALLTYLILTVSVFATGKRHDQQLKLSPNS